jgi:hypothetical protein
VSEAKIGAGGMGEVYRGVDTRLTRPVAVKILPPDLLQDDDRRRRFTQEAKAASALNHPNIVTIYDVGSEAGIDLIVMEHVEGKVRADAPHVRHGYDRRSGNIAGWHAGAVVAVRTSAIVAGDMASGQNSYSRLAAVSSRSRSAVVSGGQGPPGSCAQTRITPSSVTAQVAQP